MTTENNTTMYAHFLTYLTLEATQNRTRIFRAQGIKCYYYKAARGYYVLKYFTSERD